MNLANDPDRYRTDVTKAGPPDSQSGFGNRQSRTPQMPLAIAVLGAGNMGVCLAKAFHKIPGVTIKYVFSQRLSVAQGLAQQFNAQAVDQLDGILRDSQVNIVVLCLPTYTRLETLKLAVRSKKHIFCEKPLALNPQMASKISTLLRDYS